MPKKRQRQNISVEVKQFALEKYDQKVRTIDICAMIKKRFKLEVSSSTVSTWNTPEYRKKIEAMGVDKITSKELRVNMKQRPRILVDMEYFLVIYIERQQDKCLPVTKSSIQEQAKIVFNRLARTELYSNDGKRVEALKDLTEESIEHYLSVHIQEEQADDEDVDGDMATINCLYNATCK